MDAQRHGHLWSDIASYTTPVLTFEDNNEQFSVMVSNSSGRVTSSTATLTVLATQGRLRLATGISELISEWIGVLHLRERVVTFILLLDDN